MIKLSMKNFSLKHTDQRVIHIFWHDRNNTVNVLYADRIKPSWHQGTTSNYGYNYSQNKTEHQTEWWKSRTTFVKIHLKKCITLTILGQCETMESIDENHWCYWTIEETYCMFCADEPLYSQSFCAYIEPSCQRMGLCSLKPQSWGMLTLFNLANPWEYRWKHKTPVQD